MIGPALSNRLSVLAVVVVGDALDAGEKAATVAGIATPAEPSNPAISGPREASESHGTPPVVHGSGLAADEHRSVQADAPRTSASGTEAACGEHNRLIPRANPIRLLSQPGPRWKAVG